MHSQLTELPTQRIASQILLGQGSFAKVYKLTENNKTYALKKISKVLINRQDRLKQLKREIDILKKIHHENIVNFVDFSEEDKQYYVIKMEFCQGQNLKKFLLSPAYQKLDPIKSKYYATKICLDYISAIAEIRNKMVTNRDIKPDNIVIQIDEKNGSIHTKMIDFGQARFMIRDAMTHTGTNGYMAPEIYFDGGSYDESCDFWSLGQTIYEIFEGVRSDSMEKQYLGSPFKQNFRPTTVKDFQLYYNQFIFQGINLTKSRTPGPFRQIIRGLLHPVASERMTFAQMLEVLKRRFIEIRLVLESGQQCQYQEQRILENITKEKQGAFQRTKIKESVQQITKINKLFTKILPYLPKPQPQPQSHQQKSSKLSSHNPPPTTLSPKTKYQMKLTISLLLALQQQLFEISNILQLQQQSLYEQILVGIVTKSRVEELVEISGEYDALLRACGDGFESCEWNWREMDRYVTELYGRDGNGVWDIIRDVFDN